MNPLKTMLVTSPFGFRGEHPVTGEPNDFHSGVDLRAYYTEAYAIEHGEVIYTQRFGTLGKTVVVDHGSYWTVYGHLNKYLVNVGDTVTPGQAICVTGNTGRTSGPHLHFEVRVKPIDWIWNKDEKGQYQGSVNPMDFLVDHWGKTHYNRINSRGLVVHEERFDDYLTRAEAFALIDRLMELGGIDGSTK